MSSCLGIVGADRDSVTIQAGTICAWFQSDFRKRMSKSGAWNRRMLVSGGSSRARAFSFIARSAST
jgi:hypothetical protein